LYSSFCKDIQFPSRQRIPLTSAHGEDPVTPSDTPFIKTQKDLYLDLHNRIFATEERIWLHKYFNFEKNERVFEQTDDEADKGQFGPKNTLLQESQRDEQLTQLLELKDALVREYPLTLLKDDLEHAKDNNLTYAAVHLKKLIGDFSRKFPLSIYHVNQLASKLFFSLSNIML
jgi:hypothetical protein